LSCEPKPACELSQNGPVVSVAISGGAALSTIGANFEAGFAMNTRNGRAIGYVRAGNSIGAGATLGVELVGQRGSLDEFVGSNDLNQNVAELEIGAIVGLNLPLEGRARRPSGVGANVGKGAGGFLHFTNATVASSGSVNVYDKVKAAALAYVERAISDSADRNKYGAGTR
jgi:hypothetical protein